MEDRKSRPEKRRRRHTFGGKSFTEALREKYCTMMTNDTSGFIIDIVFHGMPKKMNPDAELDFLRNVVLSCKGVSCAGLPHGGLSSLCPNVVDLDLSSNLLDDWEESLTIVSQLPCLKFVNLSRNILINKENFLQKWRKPLPQIENLVLNQTGVPWEDIITLSHHIPSLRELHACNNGYDKLSDQNTNNLDNINCLRLNNNRITSWEEVWKLSHLQNLHSLILSGNPLKDVYYSEESKLQNHQCGTTCTASTQTDENGNNTPIFDVRNLVSNLISEAVQELEKMDCDNGESDMSELSDLDNQDVADVNDVRISGMEDGCHDNTDVDMMVESEAREKDDAPSCPNCGLKMRSNKGIIPFQNLKNLCLSETKLSDWEDLQALSQFPSLESLRIMDISLLTDMSREERRKFYLANLPHIKILNASEVTVTERDKAERHFLRYFSDKEPKPKRCAELESKHGQLKPLVEIDLGGRLKEWVALQFYHRGMKAFTHTVRVFEPVGTLRLLAADKLRLYASFKTFRMYHFPCGPDHDTEEIPKLEELMLESLPMSRFDIMEGDQIHIDTDDGFTSHKGKLHYLVLSNYL